MPLHRGCLCLVVNYMRIMKHPGCYIGSGSGKPKMAYAYCFNILSIDYYKRKHLSSYRQL
jgi:hypothetical protein